MTTKANPEIYRLASQRIGKNVSEIIFVDDNVNAVKTAKIGGMISYGIYDESSEEFINEMKNNADRYLESFAELL